MASKKSEIHEAKSCLIDVDGTSFDRLPCCGIKSRTHSGRAEKRCWIEENAKFGLRAKALLTSDGQPGGYIEYIPGESAWRAVDAAGYLFIHCIWISSRRNQRKGLGRLMVDACLKDAKRAGKAGVAVMVRDGPWMANRRLFLASGFESVATAPPDYELLVWKFKKSAKNPQFKGDWDRKLRRYGRGLTMILSSQCPHIAKFRDDIVDCAKAEYGIKPKVVELRSPSDAQSAPTPYATFSLIYDGQLLADHPISRTRFRNIMRKVGTPSTNKSLRLGRKHKSA